MIADVLIDNDEKLASSKNILYSRHKCKNHTLFMTKRAEKPYPLGLYIPKTPYKGVCPGYLNQEHDAVSQVRNSQIM